MHTPPTLVVGVVPDSRYSLALLQSNMYDFMSLTSQFLSFGHLWHGMLGPVVQKPRNENPNYSVTAHSSGYELSRVKLKT